MSEADESHRMFLEKCTIIFQACETSNFRSWEPGAGSQKLETIESDRSQLPKGAGARAAALSVSSVRFFLIFIFLNFLANLEFYFQKIGKMNE